MNNKSNLFENISKFSNINSENKLNHNQIQKMVIIFNALNDGWTIKKIDNDKFEFTKDKEQIKEELNLEEYIKKYMKINI